MDEETTIKDIKTNLRTKLKEMDKVAVGKKVTGFIAGQSVGQVVSRALAANTPVTKPYHKVQLMIAGVALGGIASDLASKWSDEQIDDLLEMVAEVQKARNGEE
jgi:hypothetical protein